MPLSAKPFDAVVLGAGPNGLAAAITLAQAGRRVTLLEGAAEIGGGSRSGELTLPGYVHDIGAAVHPMGLASPFLAALGLERYGLKWRQPAIPLAHPLNDGSAVALVRSLEETARTLGEDASAYRSLLGPTAQHLYRLLPDLLSPLHKPAHPLLLAGFGFRAMLSAEILITGRFGTERARALLGGLAAHSIMPFVRFGGAAFAMLLGAAAHTVGWPLAEGGSQAIAAAMARCFLELGGEIQTGVSVKDLDELPDAEIIMLDVTPRQFLRIAGQRLPDNYRKKLDKFRYGPGIFKLDYALDGPLPWRAAECRLAGTLHLGGSYDDIAAAENAVSRGEHPEKPFVFLVQPTVCDPGRAPEGKHIAWAYCHVPNGSDVDMTAAVEAQIERFAPGFGKLVLARHAMDTAAVEAFSPNFVGGDIAGGRQDPRRLFIRPLGRRHTYDTPLDGVYFCSSSLPPGAGVHGMCGYHAARLALRRIR